MEDWGAASGSFRVLSFFSVAEVQGVTSVSALRGVSTHSMGLAPCCWGFGAAAFGSSRCNAAAFLPVYLILVFSRHLLSLGSKRCQASVTAAVAAAAAAAAVGVGVALSLGPRERAPMRCCVWALWPCDWHHQGLLCGCLRCFECVDFGPTTAWRRCE